MAFKISSASEYKEEYRKSITNPKEFWATIAENFFWFEKWNKVSDCDLSQGKISWFVDGKTNLAYNCLDRNLEKFGDKTAIIWEGNETGEKSQKITYKELHEQVCQFANLLLAHDVKKGDRVCIYMPMIPQSLVAMLACARIGAIHCVVFAGFSAKALADRIKDCGAKMLITADLLFRGDKTIDLFKITVEALRQGCNSVKSAIVYKREKGESSLNGNSGFNYFLWQSEIKKFPVTHQAEVMDSEDALFVLYTSGSTGEPKGIVHTTGGYMTYAGYSFQNVFQYREGEVFFCTADIGWITGHSYLAYGPLLNGATILMFEGIPTHPTPSRFWEIIEKHKVNIFYTAPTAIRSLMQKSDEFAKGCNLSSLRVLGSVGEPINVEAWQWYFDKIGNKKCPIVDTWWQTETGGILISALAGITESAASHAGLPLPGIVPILIDEFGQEVVKPNITGKLYFEQPWPGMAKSLWNDHARFVKTYYKQFPGYYFSGDGAFFNKNGLYRITGRTDDVIKVSGHRLSSAEIENVINSHEAIAESAAVSAPHEVKGSTIYAFVSRKESGAKRKYSQNFLNSVKKIAHDEDAKKSSLGQLSHLSDKDLKSEIIATVQNQIGAIAKPEKIFIVPELPKTRSGKIMRRILKKIVAGEEDLGDISTLANPDIINTLKHVINSDAR